MSVIIPAYNATATLDRALDSVEAQYDCIGETIVVDDGSQDETSAIALKRPGVIVLRQPNYGVAAARNNGIRSATFPIIAFLDADDEWLPTKLQQQIAIFEEWPDVGFTCTNFIEHVRGQKSISGFDKHPAVYALPAKVNGNTRVATSNVFESICNSLFVGTSTVVVRKNILLSCGMFDCRFGVAEDFDLWLKLALATKVAILDERLMMKYDLPESLCDDESRTLMQTGRMLASFEERNGRLTASQRGALSKRLARVNLALGNLSRTARNRRAALGYYYRSFRGSPNLPAVRGAAATAVDYLRNW